MLEVAEVNSKYFSHVDIKYFNVSKITYARNESHMPMSSLKGLGSSLGPRCLFCCNTCNTAPYVSIREYLVRNNRNLIFVYTLKTYIMVGICKIIYTL